MAFEATGTSIVVRTFVVVIVRVIIVIVAPVAEGVLGVVIPP